MQKKVTIIVPIYNCEEYLEECIGSLVNQTYSNLEIILVNDGSTDQSLEVISKYTDKVKIVDKQNGGVSSARNAGLKISTGDYVMFVDADDWIKYDMVEKMMFYADKYDIVRCGLIVEGKNQRNFVNLTDDSCELTEEVILDKLINTYEMSNPVCQVIKRSLVQNYFDIDVEYGEDFLFNLSLYRKTRIFQMSECMYHYRFNEKSITNCTDISKTISKCNCVLKVYPKLFDYISIINRDTEKNKKMISIRILKELHRAMLNLFKNNNITKSERLNIINNYNSTKEVIAYKSLISSKDTVNLNITDRVFVKMLLNNKIYIYYHMANLLYGIIYRILRY